MKKSTAIKLFVDAHVMDGGYQGSRTFIREIYSIIAAETDINLYVGAYNTDNLATIFRGCGNIHFVKYKANSRATRLAFDISMIIKKHEIQYAHFQYIVPLVKNCRFIVTTHDMLFNDFPEDFSTTYRTAKNFLYKYGASRADILTTVSAYSKKSIQQHLDIAAEKIHIVPNAVNEQFFLKSDKNHSKNIIRSQFGIEKYVLCLGRFEPRKNHVMLLNAWYELGLYRQGYQLVIPGEKTLAVPDFDRALNKLPPDARGFVKTGMAVPDELLPHLYNAAALFVYPSRAEGFGIPPLEAAALLTPVLCSSTTAMKDFEFFGEGQFDPADYETFKTKLSATLQQPPAEEQLKAIAGKIKAQYSWKRSAAILYELITNDFHNTNK